ncbi:MAG: HAMP domain-containing histidine kinase [Desulfobacterales bacterium]|jgi:signal transduction histidine kinase|nr:HAMP domain-containing histidine kinase [Desulfobacterales bacterium]
MSLPTNGGRGNRPAQSGFFQEISIEFLIHELKDPISIIETGLRTVLEKQDAYGPLTAKQANTLKRSLRNTRKAWGLLNDLLEIGRSEAGCLACSRFFPLKSLRQALKDALETMTGPAAEEIGKYQDEAELARLLDRHGISLCVSEPTAGIEVFQDEIKFRQITGNLFKNALHHRRQRLEVRMETEGGWLAVEVRDDGPGIEPDHHELIFRRYTQVKECTLGERRGHGLGLAGALILARSIGGDIRVTSRKGQGATFRLTLPLELTQSA